MDFGRYLLYTQRLTFEEYLSLLKHQLNLRLLKEEKHGFPPFHLNDVDNISQIEELPFGESLKNWDQADVVFGRAQKGLKELVSEWEMWHRDRLKPICNYSLSSKTGQRLYEQQLEKQLVARYLVTARVRGGDTIIRDGDKVLIPEGTSGAYVGLAIAAERRNVTIITSNTVLIREYQDNPAVAKRLHRFIVIGGDASAAGVSGEACNEQYGTAIKKDPKATIVIVTVNGLLPKEGPRDVYGEEDEIRNTMVQLGLEHRVREVVFIADYTKHISDRAVAYGHPIFPIEWEQIIKDHQSQICIVTVPPPALRAALNCGEGHDVANRNLDLLKAPEPFSERDRNYDKVAKEMDRLVATAAGGRRIPKYHEAFEARIPQNRITVTVAEPYESVRENEFKNALMRFAGLDDLTELAVMRKRAADHTLVVIEGAVDLQELICEQFKCESPTFDSPEAREFREITGAVRFEAISGVKKFAFQLAQQPVSDATSAG